MWLENAVGAVADDAVGLMGVLHNAFEEGRVCLWGYPIIPTYRSLLFCKITPCNLLGYGW